MVVTEFPIITDDKEGQSANAEIPITSTKSPITTVSNKLQEENTAVPIPVTELGIVTVVNRLQASNVYSPRLVTMFPIVTLVKFATFGTALVYTVGLPVYVRPPLELLKVTPDHIKSTPSLYAGL
jgi:hypothetical protein